MKLNKLKKQLSKAYTDKNVVLIGKLEMKKFEMEKRRKYEKNTSNNR